MTTTVAWRITGQTHTRLTALDLTPEQVATSPGLVKRLLQQKWDVPAGTIQILPQGMGPAVDDPFAQALIQQGVDYAMAADKAFMEKRANLPGAHLTEAQATAGQDATAKALGLYLGISEALAEELILKAVQ